MKLAKVLSHKYFLYAAYALMVVNLLGYVSVGSMECIVVFALATYACKYCMTKNMGLCIFAGLFVANVLFGCGRVKEGFDTAMAAKAKNKEECDKAKGKWDNNSSSDPTSHGSGSGAGGAQHSK